MLRRGALAWLGVRGLGSAALFLADIAPLHLTVGMHLVLVATATLAAFSQTLRLRELTLLANLGVTRATIAALYAVSAIAGETLVTMAGRVW